MPRGSKGGEALDLRDVDAKVKDRFFSKTQKRKPHLIWTGATTGNGRYPQIGINKRVYSATRVAYAFTDPIPTGLEVAVTCSARLCVERTHLLLGSREEMNLVRRESNRRWKRVKEVRSLYLEGASHTELLRLWGSEHDSLNAMLMNRRWYDPEYDPGDVSRRRNHPEIFRFSTEAIEEIKGELRSGVSLNKVSKWLGAPVTTVWEAVNGPSSMARRQNGLS